MQLCKVRDPDLPFLSSSRCRGQLKEGHCLRGRFIHGVTVSPDELDGFFIKYSPSSTSCLAGLLDASIDRQALGFHPQTPSEPLAGVHERTWGRHCSAGSLVLAQEHHLDYSLVALVLFSFLSNQSPLQFCCPYLAPSKDPASHHPGLVKGQILNVWAQ